MNKRISGYKGFYGVYKAKVTRRHDEDPEGLGRIQVWVPAYHGGTEPDPAKIGTPGELGEYPWAQVCTVNFARATGLWGRILSFLGLNKMPIIYPEVGDTVYVKFEQGDIRFPIYIGSHTMGDDISILNSDPSSQYTLQSLATQMILQNESNSKYNAVNWNDNGGISVGLLQWHNNRAKEVFVLAREINANEFDSILRKHNAMDFLNELRKNVSWNNWVKADAGSAWGKAILEILDSSCGRQAQDQILKRDVGRYVDEAIGKGYIDAGAIMFYADILNKMGNMRRFNHIKPSTCTYITMYNEACRLIRSAVTRWKRNKSFIENLIRQGILIKDANGMTHINNINSRTTVNRTLLTWPVPNYTNISKSYSNSSRYIYISQNNILGAKVVASHSGKASFKYDSINGYYVEITGKDSKGNKIVTRYKHLNSMTKSRGTTVDVLEGSAIGTVGQTGNVTRPLLRFELEINGSLTNPVPYLQTPTVSTNSEIFNRIYNEAIKHLGKPYVFGTQGPNTFDCSGFVWYVFKQCKLISWPRTDVYNIYHKHVIPIPNGQQQPGDLVFFQNTYKKGLSHVGIYIGGDRMIHAGNPVQIASISSFGNKFYGYGRVKFS